MSPLAPAYETRIKERLAFLYGADRVEDIWVGLCERMELHAEALSKVNYKEGWDQEDVVLITYGDTIDDPDSPGGLQSLKAFADEWLKDYFNIIHLLPIFPYTSDDGFSVADYRTIRPDLGDWTDLESLGENFDLMFDFVLNHCSRVSLYFADFRAQRPGHEDFFIYEDPKQDWSMVTRPRSSPLLTEIPTHQGLRHVWTTFSADQVDLNYKCPQVLLEVLDIFMLYLSKGSRITRLDAVAFIWKKLGTTCMHLPEAHEIVKLMRDIAEALCPNAILLTETNVPHEENISYFGQGDEAHMVYQFSLPPLLLHAIHSSKTKYLYEWLKNLTLPPEGCTYFNFTASHDGIGVRPLEGLLPEDELKQLLEDMRARGAYVSTRANAQGEHVPYEINVTYYDAFRNPGQRSAPWQDARYMLSQTVALSLKGIPGVYIHAMLATPNDHWRVEITGSTRSINRHQWNLDELSALLEVSESTTHFLVEEYTRRIAIRRQQPAFHPDAEQLVLDLEDGLLGILRVAHTGERIVALYNFMNTFTYMNTNAVKALLGGHTDDWADLLHDQPLVFDEECNLKLKPYACHWLTIS